jgi:DNA-binding MarR family transcriptional regulator
MQIDQASYRQKHREMAYVLSEFMVPYLLRLYRAFDGDMAEMIVLGEIAQRNVSRLFAAGTADAGLRLEEVLGDPAQRQARLVPCNALSVAETTGIPRETVRRTVQKLIARGWIVREADGYLYVTPAVAGHFEAFNFETFEGLLAAADRLRRLAGAESQAVRPG